jgi:hypothetical protein
MKRLLLAVAAADATATATESDRHHLHLRHFLSSRGAHGKNIFLGQQIWQKKNK